MKTLILLRHAKSGWDDHAVRDFDRRLNPKGERAARTMGNHMRSMGLSWDHAIASPAIRVVETLEQIAAGYGRAIEDTVAVQLGTLAAALQSWREWNNAG